MVRLAAGGVLTWWPRPQTPRPTAKHRVRKVMRGRGDVLVFLYN